MKKDSLTQRRSGGRVSPKAPRKHVLRLKQPMNPSATWPVRFRMAMLLFFICSTLGFHKSGIARFESAGPFRFPFAGKGYFTTRKVPTARASTPAQ
jgi:hypothetical protein